MQVLKSSIGYRSYLGTKNKTKHSFTKSISCHSNLVLLLIAKVKSCLCIFPLIKYVLKSEDTEIKKWYPSASVPLSKTYTQCILILLFHKIFSGIQGCVFVFFFFRKRKNIIVKRTHERKTMTTIYCQRFFTVAEQKCYNCGT